MLWTEIENSEGDSDGKWGWQVERPMLSLGAFLKVYGSLKKGNRPYMIGEGEVQWSMVKAVDGNVVVVVRIPRWLSKILTLWYIIPSLWYIIPSSWVWVELEGDGVSVPQLCYFIWQRGFCRCNLDSYSAEFKLIRRKIVWVGLT